MIRVDPWVVSLEALSVRPPRYGFASSVGRPSWRPEVTRNPRHSRSPCFLELEAVAFVAKRLREFTHRRAHGLECRTETLRSDPSQMACVMVVHPLKPAVRVPPVYVKWTLRDAGLGAWFVRFISFHESTRHHVDERSP